MVGRRLENNDESDWIVMPDAHEPIVSRACSQAARDLMKAKQASRSQHDINPRTGAPAGQPLTGTGPRAKFLLSGLCVCAHCGSRYEGYTRYTSPRDADGRRTKTYHYACGGYIRHGRSVCKLRAIGKDELEEHAINKVSEHFAPLTGDRGRADIIELLTAEYGHRAGAAATSRNEISGQIQSIDDKVRSLLDNISSSNAAIANQRVAELSRQREDLESQLLRLDHYELSEAEIERRASEIGAFLRTLDVSLRHGPLEARQAAARACILKVVIDRDTAQWTLEHPSLPHCMSTT